MSFVVWLLCFAWLGDLLFFGLAFLFLLGLCLQCCFMFLCLFACLCACLPGLRACVRACVLACLLAGWLAGWLAGLLVCVCLFLFVFSLCLNDASLATALQMPHMLCQKQGRAKTLHCFSGFLFKAKLLPHRHAMPPLRISLFRDGVGMLQTPRRRLVMP